MGASAYVNVSGTSAVALALLVVTALLLAVTAIAVRPREVAPPTSGSAPRADVKGEARSAPAPRERRRAEPSPAAQTAETAESAASAESAARAEPAAPRRVVAPSAEAVVIEYYAALDDRRFGAAWRTLSPAVRAAFGGFDGWRDGYATTLSSRPGDLRVSPVPGGATVEHVLVATDRSPCGEVRRRFAVTWKLVRVDGTWMAASLSAVKRSGPEPAAACA